MRCRRGNVWGNVAGDSGEPGMSELVYPQLTQLPLLKRLRRRTVVNRMADGRTVKLGDPAGEITEWELRYQELSDVEAATLQTFFESAEGSLQPFTFLDPTGNLLLTSAALDGAAWTRDPMLRVTGGPLEWRLENTGEAPQALWQDIGGPAGFTYCFSLSARSEVTTVIRATAGNLGVERTISGLWRRVKLSGPVETTRFGIEVRPSTWVEVRGLQVEAQAGASQSRRGVRGGVFAGAHFDQDELELTTTGLNQHSCTVKIVHAIHI
jgi:hypothetical protein